jgi:PPK2 family polyphosphate:nucleotide phosphotransferase
MSWASKFSKPYRVENGKKFRLKDHDPSTTGHFRSQQHAEKLLQQGIDEMREQQDKLYAQNSWALLLVLQAMDAAGKDGLIKHVMSGVNPQGCHVHSFKQPSSEELGHDFLWRANKVLPERGHIGIFNRSYYEEVLVVRVHPELLKNERIPKEVMPKDIWQQRFEDIHNFERCLTHNGIAIRKFFLNLSKEEQKRRFLQRLENPEKNWKFSPGDVRERGHWDEYMKAYEEMIAATSTKRAPWYVVPADNKWYTRLVVAAAIVDTLDDLKLEYPKGNPQERKELLEARKQLEKETDKRQQQRAHE